MIVLKILGIVLAGLIGLVCIIYFIFMPFAAGRWALDRFGEPFDFDAVVLRQDKASKPLFICADGPDRAPTHCLDVQMLITLGRQQGATYDPKRLAR